MTDSRLRSMAVLGIAQAADIATTAAGMLAMGATEGHPLAALTPDAPLLPVIVAKIALVAVCAEVIARLPAGHGFVLSTTTAASLLPTVLNLALLTGAL